MKNSYGLDFLVLYIAIFLVLVVLAFMYEKVENIETKISEKTLLVNDDVDEIQVRETDTSAVIYRVIRWAPISYKDSRYIFDNKKGSE